MTKKALLIGINYFESPYELHGCITDIENMKNVLIKHYQFREEDIVVLRDDEHADELPTRDTILFHIDDLMDETAAGDTLFFHYSGHGVQLPDYNRDEASGMDDAIVPADYETRGYITDDTIYDRLISKVKKGVKLTAFFDCCHSGSICDLRFNYKYVSATSANDDVSQWGNDFKSWQENRRTIQGDIVMYSGCYDEQTSADANINMIAQGAFTFVMLEILKTSNYQISNRNLLKKLNAMLYLDGFTQRPQLSCSHNNMIDGPFAI